MARNTNFKPCPHVTSWKNRHETKSGVVFLCDDCQRELESRLADPQFIRGMLKSTMTGHEITQMRHERLNMQLEREIMDAVKIAHMIAGFPQRVALPAPVEAGW